MVAIGLGSLCYIGIGIGMQLVRGREGGEGGEGGGVVEYLLPDRLLC